MDGSTDSIMRLPAVLRRTGLSRSTLYRKIGDGSFPRQVRLSTRCAGWYASDVTAWIEQFRRGEASPRA